MYPENHSAAIDTKDHEGAIRYCEHSESKGYSMDLCSYARINIGYMESKREIGRGLDVPDPDFVVVSNNICNTVIKWYENIARELSIPYVFFDMPYNMDACVLEHKIQYMVDQLEPTIRQIEGFSGKQFDYNKFAEILEISSENGRLWQEALDLIGTIPSPVSGFEGYNYMALLVAMKGVKETSDILRQFVKELKEKIKSGVSSFGAEEKHRIMFEGIANWPHLRYTSEKMKSHGMNIAGSVYCDTFTQQFSSIAEYCSAYSGTNNNSSINMRLQRRKRMIKQYGCEGVVAHITRSCKPWVGLIYETVRQLESEHNIPATVFDGDHCDPRVFSKAQFETRLQGLVEVMEERKKRKVQ
jgi:(R)-2-hydroxyisocaproyl-CoA dehydratase alpha subunit